MDGGRIEKWVLGYDIDEDFGDGKKEGNLNYKYTRKFWNSNRKCRAIGKICH